MVIFAMTYAFGVETFEWTKVSLWNILYFWNRNMSDFEEAPGKQFQDVRKQEGIVFLAYPSGSRC
jgi:hypothetical protein